MTSKYETLDSGKREEYASGMHRDTQSGKPRYDLIDPVMLKRWAELMSRGAEKYQANNWRKADSQEELDRFISSAMRHLMQWRDGETGEDHAAAVLFNIAAAEYVKGRIDRTINIPVRVLPIRVLPNGVGYADFRKAEKTYSLEANGTTLSGQA